MIDFTSRAQPHFTWLDLARAWLPDAPDDHLGYVLWNETPYPFGSVEDVERMLASYAADPEAHSARIDASLAAMSAWEDDALTGSTP